MKDAKSSSYACAPDTTFDLRIKLIDLLTDLIVRYTRRKRMNDGDALSEAPPAKEEKSTPASE